MFKKRISLRINNRKVMYGLLAFVLVGITTMTIAYATLSTTLRITGSAEFEDASWSLTLEEFDEVLWDTEGASSVSGNVVTYGSGKLITKPTISGTTLSGYKISLKNPGDAVYADYKLTNTGDIPAILDSVTWNNPTITSSTNSQEDIQLIYTYFNPSPYMYELFYEDGEVVNATYISSVGYVICPGAVVEVGIAGSFSWEAPRAPYSKMTISDIDISFNFVAADQNLCDGSTYVGEPDEG